VKKLLEIGADATVTNNLGLMPKALAQKMMYTDVIDPDRYKDVIELFDNQPVYFKEARPKVSTNPQVAPSEKNSERIDICKYFKGHVLHWSGNLSKEDDYSVYDIIYGDGLAKSMEKLRGAIKTVEEEKIKNEEAAKKKEESMKELETEEEAKLRKKNELKREKSKMADDEAKKNKKSDQRSEQPAKLFNEAPKEAGIQKEAKRWIHLPANNVSSKALHNQDCSYGR
jgi:hypothetical protein